MTSPTETSVSDLVSRQPQRASAPLPRRHVGTRVHDEHLQAVLDVRLAHVRVVVEREHLRVGVELLHALDDAATDHVVGQAPKGLQDHEVAHAARGLLQDLRRDEDPLPGVEGVVDDRVAHLRQLRHARRPLVEREVPRDSVDKGEGGREEPVRDGVPGALARGDVHMVLAGLRVLVGVALADDVGHAGLHDLEAVALEVALDLVVGAGMEVEQVLADDEDTRPRAGAVVRHRREPLQTAREGVDRAAGAVRGYALDQAVHGPLEGGVRRARFELVGADPAQERLVDVDHRNAEHEVRRGGHAQAEARVQVVRVRAVDADPEPFSPPVLLAHASPFICA